MDLARAPRRARLTARKKGSGYENDTGGIRGTHPRPQADGDISSNLVPRVPVFKGSGAPEPLNRGTWALVHQNL